MKISIHLLKKSNTIRLKAINKDHYESSIKLNRDFLKLKSLNKVNSHESLIKFNSNKNLFIKAETIKFACEKLVISSSNKFLIEKNSNYLTLDENIKISHENIELKSEVFKITSPLINFNV